MKTVKLRFIPYFSPSLLVLSLLLFTLTSCYQGRVSSPYRESTSNCGRIVLQPFGKAVLTKCGEIMWKEEGSWTRSNDTIQVQFRNQWDNRKFLVKKGKLLQIVNDSIAIKPHSKIYFEE